MRVNVYEHQREDALKAAAETLRAITGSHNRTPFSEGSVIGPCKCRACVTLLRVETALETYK